MMYSTNGRDKNTSDNDSDEEYLLKKSDFIWQDADTLNKDIFILSTENLMKLPFINI